MTLVRDEKQQISKIEAARRQLDCAIELWFCDKDEVSIHTLAAAAYQIIHDLKMKRGELRDLLYELRHDQGQIQEPVDKGDQETSEFLQAR